AFGGLAPGAAVWRVVAGWVRRAGSTDVFLGSATPPPLAGGRLYRIPVLPGQCPHPTDRRRAPADRAADGTAGAWRGSAQRRRDAQDRRPGAATSDTIRGIGPG